MTTKLPGARAALVDNAGVMTPQFYRFFSSLEKLPDGTASDADIAAVNAQLAALQAEIDALPESNAYPKLQVTYPILSQGLLQNGFAKLALDQPGDSGTGSLLAFVKDAWGRITGTKAATITGTAGRVTVANGDASAGLPTIDLATVADAGGGSLLRIVRDAWGRVTGTSATAVADLKSAGLVVPQGYIDGLQMQWVSGTAVTVSSGAAYIPALGNVLQVNSAIALTGLSLAASTWYHLYLYSNTGTPAVECVTTAPVLYSGTAYQKTGDNSRRYVGSVRAGPSGAIYDFVHMADGFVRYLESTMSNGTEFALFSGSPVTPTTVSCANVVPVTGFNAQLHSDNNAQQQMAFANSMCNFTLSISANLHISSALPTGFTERLIFTLPLDRSQAFQFMYVSAPSATVTIRLFGYWYQR